MSAAAEALAEKRFSRRRKIIGNPPLGRKVIVCTGITS
jgi:hypothetical protein